ncbi:MAG TPA: cytochrome c [Thermoanaerobaculia bacterium]|nr:cytochrome c [Thermoanaerobaculia bacterium]
MKKLTIVLIALSLVSLPMFAADDAAALFQTKCAACHGKTGAADTPMAKMKKIPNFASDEVQGKTDAQLTTIISDGPEGVKGHDYKAKGLTDDQIKGLVGFIRTLKK